MLICKTIVISIRLSISIYIQLKKHQPSKDFSSKFSQMSSHYLRVLHFPMHHHHRSLHSQSPDGVGWGGINKIKRSDWTIQSQIFLRWINCCCKGYLVGCMLIHKYWPVLDMWLIPQIHISAAGTCINTDFTRFRLFTFLVCFFMNKHAAKCLAIFYYNT